MNEHLGLVLAVVMTIAYLTLITMILVAWCRGSYKEIDMPCDQHPEQQRIPGFVTRYAVKHPLVPFHIEQINALKLKAVEYLSRAMILTLDQDEEFQQMMELHTGCWRRIYSICKQYNVDLVDTVMGKI